MDKDGEGEKNGRKGSSGRKSSAGIGDRKESTEK